MIQFGTLQLSPGKFTVIKDNTPELQVFNKDDELIENQKLKNVWQYGNFDGARGFWPDICKKNRMEIFKAQVKNLLEPLSKTGVLESPKATKEVKSFYFCLKDKQQQFEFVTEGDTFSLVAKKEPLVKLKVAG